jgi:acetylornithine deacetylase/succinyl-diaminopimelate desuccinylase-like protein
MTGNRFFKSLTAAGLIVAFLFINTASPDGAAGTSRTLSPDTRFAPLVSIQRANGRYIVVENTGTGVMERGLPASRFRDDVAFIYISQLIGQALDLDIGIEVFKELIEEHLSSSGAYSRDLLDRYDLDRMWLENGVYCLPYTRSDDPSREQLLRYYLPDDDHAPGTAASPDRVTIPAGEVTVILEDPEMPAYSLPDIGTNITEFGKIGRIDPRDPSKGISRLGYTRMETAAHKKLAKLMQKLGMKVWIDEFGNTYGRHETEATDTRAPPVRIISHLDSVPAGGKFDGTAGILTGLDTISKLIDNNVPLKNPVELVAYRCEESSRFDKAMIGSALATTSESEADENGENIRDSILNRKSVRGKSKLLGAAVTEEVDHMIDAVGLEQRPAYPLNEKDRPAAVYEVHVEQGNKLYNTSPDIGLVEGIAAPVRFSEIFSPRVKDGEKGKPSSEELLLVTVTGQKDHSGATPMLDPEGNSARKDALCAAADLVDKLSISTAREDLVYGIRIEEPSINTIPGRVTLLLRDCGDPELLRNVTTEIMDERPGIHADLSRKPAYTASGDIPRSKNCPMAFMALMKVALELENTAGDICEELQASEDHGDTALPVGTVGKLGLDEKTGDLVMGIDIRGYNINTRQRLADAFKRRAGKILREYDRYFTDYTPPAEWTDTETKYPTPTSDRLRRSLASSARDLDIDYSVFHSGAGHDLMNLRKLTNDIALIFVPSIDGKSHTPEEDTDIRDLEKASRLLYDHLIKEYALPADESGIGISEEHDHVSTARNFIDRVKLYADQLSKHPDPRKQKLLLGFEMDWIDALDDASSPAKELINRIASFLDNELPRLLREKGLENVHIVREHSHDLAKALKREAGEHGISYSNVIALCGKNSLDMYSGEFLPLALNDALLVGIDPVILKASAEKTADSMEYLHINLIEMVNAAVQLHKAPANHELLRTETLSINVIERGGNTFFVLIPDTGAYDLETLDRRYEAQLTAMRSA